jgi:hypothetical protein
VPRQLNVRTAEPRTLPDRRDVGQPADAVDVGVDGETVEVHAPEPDRGGLVRELVPEVLFLLGTVYLFAAAGDFTGNRKAGELGPAFWPRLVAVGLAVTLLIRIVQTIREHRRPVVRVPSEFDDVDGAPATLHWRSVAVAMALAVGYVWSTMFIGYLFATIAFLAGFAWLGGQRRWYTPAVAIAGGLVMTYVFVGVVYVSVPTGVGVFDTVTVAIYRLLGIQ